MGQAKLKTQLNLNKTLTTRKQFNYEVGIVKLDFSLVIDDKTELQNFRRCLTEALTDVEAEIENLQQ